MVGMQKKTFETESAAKAFAEKVDGTVRLATLPGYMAVETIWIVEWKGGDE
jgi:translation initiation factor IF-1